MPEAATQTPPIETPVVAPPPEAPQQQGQGGPENGTTGPAAAQKLEEQVNAGGNAPGQVLENLANSGTPPPEAPADHLDAQQADLDAQNNQTINYGAEQPTQPVAAQQGQPAGAPQQEQTSGTPAPTTEQPQPEAAPTPTGEQTQAPAEQQPGQSTQSETPQPAQEVAQQPAEAAPATTETPTAEQGNENQEENAESKDPETAKKVEETIQMHELMTKMESLGIKFLDNKNAKDYVAELVKNPEHIKSTLEMINMAEQQAKEFAEMMKEKTGVDINQKQLMLWNLNGAIDQYAAQMEHDFENEGLKLNPDTGEVEIPEGTDPTKAEELRKKGIFLKILKGLGKVLLTVTIAAAGIGANAGVRANAAIGAASKSE